MMPPRRPMPPELDQEPSPFICSCDADSAEDKYNDACGNYADLCVLLLLQTTRQHDNGPDFMPDVKHYSWLLY